MEALREQIDLLDQRLVELINERAEVAGRIGSVKRAAAGESGGLPIYVPAREREVYDRVTTCNQGPMPDGAIKAIFREIMSGSISIERQTRVSYLGPEGSFTHLAVRQHVSASTQNQALSAVIN